MLFRSPTFDVKAYVDKMRSEKQQDLMGMFGSNPGGFTGGMNPMSGMNPGMPFFGSKPQPFNDESSGGGINFDDLVKRIDAKIAEIEEEEKREKETIVTNEEIPSLLDDDGNIISSDDVEEKKNEIVDKSNDVLDEKVVNEVKLEEKPKDRLTELEEKFNDIVTDDQFFDDFFSDDE